jgi:hypothetical protein
MSGYPSLPGVIKERLDGIRSFLAEVHTANDTPVIFVDSHPEEQDNSYLGPYITSLKSSLSTAWTGIVPPFHEPGELRIVWWTTDGNQGNKDYPLRKYVEVREYYNTLVDHPEVRRCLIMGYQGQNPYSETAESNLLLEMLNENEKELARTVRQAETKKAMEEGKVKPNEPEKLIDVDEIVTGTQVADEVQRLKEAEAREKTEV